MFISIKTDLPDNNTDVLVKLSDGTITGARYKAQGSDIQNNFFMLIPIDAAAMGFSRNFEMSIISWLPLEALK